MVLFFIPWEPPHHITTIENIVRWGEGVPYCQLHYVAAARNTKRGWYFSILSTEKRNIIAKLHDDGRTVNTSTDALLSSSSSSSSEEEEGPFFK